MSNLDKTASTAVSPVQPKVGFSAAVLAPTGFAGKSTLTNELALGNIIQVEEDVDFTAIKGATEFRYTQMDDSAAYATSLIQDNEDVVYDCGNEGTKDLYDVAASSMFLADFSRVIVVMSCKSLSKGRESNTYSLVESLIDEMGVEPENIRVIANFMPTRSRKFPEQIVGDIYERIGELGVKTDLNAFFTDNAGLYGVIESAGFKYSDFIWTEKGVSTSKFTAKQVEEIKTVGSAESKVFKRLLTMANAPLNVKDWKNVMSYIKS